MGNIVISKIVIPQFCPIHCTITFAGQTNVDCYTGNIVIPKIVKPGFHCSSHTCRQEVIHQIADTIQVTVSIFATPIMIMSFSVKVKVFILTSHITLFKVLHILYTQLKFFY